MAKPRVWEGFKGKLPKWEGDEPEWIEKVRIEKEKLAGLSRSEIALIQKDLREEKDRLKAREKEVNILYEACQSTLVERLEAQGERSFTLTGGELFYLKDEPYTKVVDVNANNQWYVDNGMDEMRTVIWQTQNAIVKERLQNGLPIPEGTEVFLKTTVVMRKS